MSTYKCRLIRKIVNAMYRDRIRDFTNTSTYPDCRDNEGRLYTLNHRLYETVASLFLGDF